VFLDNNMEHLFKRALPALLAWLPCTLYADGFAQTGFTGYLRTPDARVITNESVQLTSGWEDNVNRDTSYGAGAHNTLMLGVGLLPGLEVVAQNTYKNFNGEAGYNAGNGGSDLSFSAKLNSQPFLPDSPVQFAVGVQDYGTHSATYHNNYYLVSQLNLEPIDISLGYGRGDTKNQMGVDYLDGPFAGARWQVAPYLDMLVDYDGTGMNGGLRLTTPDNWLPDGWQLNTTVQGFSDSSTPGRDNAWLSVGLKVDLGRSTRKAGKDYAYKPFRANDIAAVPAVLPEPNTTALPMLAARLIGAKAAAYNPDDLLSRLDQLGLENLRAGRIGDIPLITYENNVYLRNEMTALGSALGIISQHIKGWYYLVAQSKQIPVLALKVHGAALLDAHQQSIRPPMRHIKYIQQDPTELLDRVTWQTETLASSRYIPRVNLSIAQRSTLGTEWGVLDYSTALATNVVFDLWPGAALDVRHFTPLADSDDADYSGHPIQPYDNTIDRALLHQTLPLGKNLFTQFSIGKVMDDYVALINESRWQSDTGRHRLSLLGGAFDPIDDASDARETMLGYYRYYLPDARHGVELFGGRFLNDDAGFGARTLHWFGNTQVNLEVKANADQTYAGMYFAFPLAASRSMRPTHFQFTGIDEWRWGYATQLNTEQNRIDNAALVETKLQHSLDRVYFNRDRLSLQYFYANLPTLMQAMRNVLR
jgi:hypothetical protein